MAKQRQNLLTAAQTAIRDWQAATDEQAPAARAKMRRACTVLRTYDEQYPKEAADILEQDLRRARS